MVGIMASFPLTFKEFLSLQGIWKPTGYVLSTQFDSRCWKDYMLKKKKAAYAGVTGRNCMCSPALCDWTSSQPGLTSLFSLP
jgi:hypothetical protein